MNCLLLLHIFLHAQIELLLLYNDKLIVSKIRELRQLRSGLREFIENNKTLLLDCGIFLDNQIDKINNRINVLKHYKA